MSMCEEDLFEYGTFKFVGVGLGVCVCVCVRLSHDSSGSESSCMTSELPDCLSQAE